MNHHQSHQQLKTIKTAVYIIILILITIGIYKFMIATPLDPFQIKTDDHVKGNINSKVILIEYSDFECPACSAYSALTDKMMEKYQNDIQLIYRHYPLTSIHPYALLAAKTSEAASLQNKFWEMHDKLFAEQDLWSKMQQPQNRFESYAKELKLDLNKFLQDLAGNAVEQRVNEDIVYPYNGIYGSVDGVTGKIAG